MTWQARAKAQTVAIRSDDIGAYVGAKSEDTETRDIDKEKKVARELAKQFCELCDEAQAEFFIEAAEIGQEWDRDHTNQWFVVGRHLETCICATEEAREMIKALRAGLINS